MHQALCGKAVRTAALEVAVRREHWQQLFADGVHGKLLLPLEVQCGMHLPKLSQDLRTVRGQ
eukprot:UN2796